ncbi:MAG: twitching motility protein PilT [Planctomycetaceae bacterium]|nr:MAG: twitching motility protein PilT [Planctomycetaceae bacterium]
MAQTKPEDPDSTSPMRNGDDLVPFPARPSRRAQKKELEIDKVFRALVKLEGSDLHMKVGSPPMIRTRGEVRSLDLPAINAEQMVALLVPMMVSPGNPGKIFFRDGGADFSYSCDVDGKPKWRFRVNLLTQLGNIGMVGPENQRFCSRLRGPVPAAGDGEALQISTKGPVLLAGVTGSGKSTTIASMLNYINRKYPKHILTLEDPIEFIYTEEKSVINQREIGEDVIDFEIAMKHAVREDPDVMLVGEMRDEETFMTAIHAAEKGPPGLRNDPRVQASTTIGRILDLFPPDMHEAIRSAIAFNTKGIVSQKLLKSIKPGVEGVPGPVEMMLFSPIVKKLILEGDDHKLPDAIRSGRTRGCRTSR